MDTVADRDQGARQVGSGHGE